MYDLSAFPACNSNENVLLVMDTDEKFKYCFLVPLLTESFDISNVLSKVRYPVVLKNCGDFCSIYTYLERKMTVFQEQGKLLCIYSVSF